MAANPSDRPHTDRPDTRLAEARVMFSAAAVEELRVRLSDARLPVFPLNDSWDHGMPKDVLEKVVVAWSDELDRIEDLAARLNALPQVDVRFDDAYSIRVFHVRSQVVDAMPIVLTHGWPSTVVENLRLAQDLASPTEHGGAASDAFHVVVPALPGFPLSAAPPRLMEYTGAGIADRWAQLMAALGYHNFAASGGDVGARVSAWLGARHPDRITGIHVTSNALRPDLPGVELTQAERDWVKARAEWSQAEGGYMHIQQTKPLTLAYGLAQSPVAMAAWIVEKWSGWSGVSDPLEHFGSELLDHLTLYWLTNTIATSFLPYYAYEIPPGARPWSADSKVPVSFYLCPNEIGGIPPRSFADHQYKIARWQKFPRGGHFTAVEQPQNLATDIREAFRPLR